MVPDMTVADLLATVVAVGSVDKHVSAAYELPSDVFPVMKTSRKPSTMYASD